MTNLLAAAPTRLDPVELFLQADVVVQAVMLGLLLASVWTWMIIISFAMKIGRLKKQGEIYEKQFWETENLEQLQKSVADRDIPASRIAGAGLKEWRRSIKAATIDRDGTRDRLRMAMDMQVAEEADNLAKRLGFLATVGSVAPFVGLFGTVWGIMNSFFQIGAQQNSSLAVVAPGISEALFATAIGLFAAIPAVIAYNRLTQSVNSYEARLHRFAERFNMSLSRQLETRS
ncbi:MAG: protein TolQ [Sphingomonadales bacterium CG12_big_fil_rev_8_21_14_0_65_65_10]|nr:MAG: protein TolQ [Sphingomonadales bacterium CG12_big_fil_rev_8_21_14_0_65_65_10]